MTETEATANPFLVQHDIARLIRHLTDRRNLAQENIKQRTDMLTRELASFTAKGYPSHEAHRLIQTSGLEINSYAAEATAYARALAEVEYVLEDLHNQGLTIAPDPNA